MSLRIRFCTALLPALLPLVIAQPARAQLNSTPQTVTLNASMAESLTVALTASGPVNFTLTGSSADAGSVIPAWNTSWNLKPSRTTVTVCAYLTGALTGTGGNTDTVPVANVLGQPDATGGFTALTGAACGQSNALTVNIYALASVGRKNITKSDSVALEINDSALTLQADTYSGTLNIIAQATP